jgi:hypothetical protein
MSGISLLALVLVLLLMAAAMVTSLLVPCVSPQSRRRAQRAAALLIGVIAVLTLPNLLLADAVDDLPTNDRAAVRIALRSAPGCWRVTRVAAIRTMDDQSARHGFRYRCEWTVLGWPSVTGEASCADGGWVLPGYLEPRYTGRPCGFAKDTGEQEALPTLQVDPGLRRGGEGVERIEC